MGYSATVSGLAIPFKFQSAQLQDVVYRFPLTFNTADSSHSYFEANIPGTAFLSQDQNRVNHCDGWGYATTPFGTFQTIRVRTRLDSFDSLSINGQTPLALQIPTRYEYQWLANNQHIPLLTISTILVGGRETVTGVVWRDIYRHITFPTTAPADQPLAALTLAPNPLPADQPLTLRGLPAGALTVEVFDVLGRRLLTRAVTGASTLTLPATALPAVQGMLLVRVTTADGAVSTRTVVRN